MAMVGGAGAVFLLLFALSRDVHAARLEGIGPRMLSMRDAREDLVEATGKGPKAKIANPAPKEKMPTPKVLVEDDVAGPEGENLGPATAGLAEEGKAKENSKPLEGAGSSNETVNSAVEAAKSMAAYLKKVRMASEMIGESANKRRVEAISHLLDENGGQSTVRSMTSASSSKQAGDPSQAHSPPVNETTPTGAAQTLANPQVGTKTDPAATDGVIESQERVSPNSTVSAPVAEPSNPSIQIQMTQDSMTNTQGTQQSPAKPSQHSTPLSTSSTSLATSVTPPIVTQRSPVNSPQGSTPLSTSSTSLATSVRDTQQSPVNPFQHSTSLSTSSTSLATSVTPPSVTQRSPVNPPQGSTPLSTSSTSLATSVTPSRDTQQRPENPSQHSTPLSTSSTSLATSVTPPSVTQRSPVNPPQASTPLSTSSTSLDTSVTPPRDTQQRPENPSQHSTPLSTSSTSLAAAVTPPSVTQRSPVNPPQASTPLSTSSTSLANSVTPPDVTLQEGRRGPGGGTVTGEEGTIVVAANDTNTSDPTKTQPLPQLKKTSSMATRGTITGAIIPTTLHLEGRNGSPLLKIDGNKGASLPRVPAALSASIAAGGELMVGDVGGRQPRSSLPVVKTALRIPASPQGISIPQNTSPVNQAQILENGKKFGVSDEMGRKEDKGMGILETTLRVINTDGVSIPSLPKDNPILIKQFPNIPNNRRYIQPIISLDNEPHSDPTLPRSVSIKANLEASRLSPNATILARPAPIFTSRATSTATSPTTSLVVGSAAAPVKSNSSEMGVVSVEEAVRLKGGSVETKLAQRAQHAKSQVGTPESSLKVDASSRMSPSDSHLSPSDAKGLHHHRAKLDLKRYEKLLYHPMQGSSEKHGNDDSNALAQWLLVAFMCTANLLLVILLCLCYAHTRDLQSREAKTVPNVDPKMKDTKTPSNVVSPRSLVS